ncbi:hypothetical protein AK830_g3034 [Neonectria ditissima]|uniref:Clr5 domain-containing protein n=1 Tax=Neonectria ditissima TaxID=78410 RepID=A0A0P7B9T5_9HYPO|nr:hypothetical protein AK830_g3034 [Neonectria ditissima]
MGYQPFHDIVGFSPRGDFPAASLAQQPLQPHTPPGAFEANRQVGFFPSSPRDHNPLPGLHLNTPRGSLQVKLPSLGEFDQGVEALARTHGPVNSWTPPSPLPNVPRNYSLPESVTLSRSSWQRSLEGPAGEFLASRRGTITSLSQYALTADQTQQPHQIYMGTDNYHGYSLHSPSPQDTDCYPSPPPEGENRHINQKYTTEEGDFIIYAWHDKKMKWQRIKQEFAARFGRTPERTVQGLQAWYYRMNQRIPIWDQDGWLIFDNEDELEPQHVGIKCRERDTQDVEPLGLAQRYPERAINYSWVDPELKRKAHDWATKREMQYRDRRDRRRRKEYRRMRL